VDFKLTKKIKQIKEKQKISDNRIARNFFTGNKITKL